MFIKSSELHKLITLISHSRCSSDCFWGKYVIFFFMRQGFFWANFACVKLFCFTNCNKILCWKIVCYRSIYLFSSFVLFRDQLALSHWHLATRWTVWDSRYVVLNCVTCTLYYVTLYCLKLHFITLQYIT